MDNLEEIEEIEELLLWNLSFNVSIKDSLEEIKRLDLLDYFINLFNY